MQNPFDVHKCEQWFDDLRLPTKINSTENIISMLLNWNTQQQVFKPVAGIKASVKKRRTYATYSDQHGLTAIYLIKKN